jgi:hypothetical protein
MCKKAVKFLHRMGENVEKIFFVEQVVHECYVICVAQRFY